MDGRLPGRAGDGGDSERIDGHNPTQGSRSRASSALALPGNAYSALGLDEGAGYKYDPPTKSVWLLLPQDGMPTLSERLAAAKKKAGQAIARRHKIAAQLDKHNRKQDARLKFILGSGAVVGKLTDRCLQHVSKEDRTFALEVLRSQAAANPVLTDHPQEPPTT